MEFHVKVAVALFMGVHVYLGVGHGLVDLIQ